MMDLLYIVVRCLRSPITDSSHRNRMIEFRGWKGCYPRAGSWGMQAEGWRLKGRYLRAESGDEEGEDWEVVVS